MTSEQRVLGALKRQPIDRVPTFEWMTSDHVVQALCPGKTYDDFVEELDIDGAVADLYYDKEWIDDKTYKDEWGMIKQITAEAHAMPLDGPIRTMKDLDSFIPPDTDKPERFKDLDSKIERHKGKRAVALHLNDVFSIPSRLMPFDEFMMKLVLEPELIQGIIEMTVEINIALAKEAVKRGCKIVFTGDDYAYNSGPMMSPDTFRKVFYPGFKRVMRGYKDLGLMVIKHSDGDIMPLIDMIMITDIDCIDPIDPLAGMDLRYMKKTYGDRFAIKGNVDCAHTLTFGSVDEVIAETKNCIDIAAPDGGFILSSSNSIHSKVKPENYKAMVDTVKEYSRY
ncbi:MAG: hypothetical protein HN389_09800 [Clostridia bacterium]|jgi:uroporphyrinogen decarboxylase|nr:hypothetical protein [Clostridia bacterium]